ncbi:hypothetical protein [Streptomyces aureocirculatus]|uniref:hypothetical protein n=1 Tax=Streptomyces aureocirculatus TaxID=67275 RepID=UPI0012FE8F04|nr:hypothetical protein [Streptomyces aureocirculatus]
MHADDLSIGDVIVHDAGDTTVRALDRKESLGAAVTAFSETAALYAILNEDTEEAECIVSGCCQTSAPDSADNWISSGAC